MASSITFLSFPSPKKALRTGAEVVQQRLDHRRREHLLNRARKRTAARVARANTAAQAANPVSAVVHRISRTLRGLFKGRRSVALHASETVVRLLGDLKTGITQSKTFRSLGRAVRSVLARLRALVPARWKASLSTYLQAKLKKRRVLRVLFGFVAVTAALAARVRRQRWQRVLASHVARSYVTTSIDATADAVVACILAEREQQRQKKRVATIEHAWIAWTTRRLVRHKRKQSLLALLSSAHSHLQCVEAHTHLVQSVAKRVATTVMDTVALELMRRRAACLLQRVWRGTRARLRVYSMLSAKKQKAFLRLQRERVRHARAALLGNSPQAVAHHKMVAMRVAARQEKAPLPVRYNGAQRRDLVVGRESLLEPLIVHHHPPRFSAATGARVLPVTFAKYEKIRALRARVNPLNTWVAIPVAYTEIEATPDRGSAGRAVMKATFDWVPVTLLSPSGENGQVKHVI